MFRTLCFASLLHIGLLTASPAVEEQLNLKDIPKIMQQILDQHLDQKVMTSKSLHGALIGYIDQFDPQRIYLLDSEVKPYIDISKSRMDTILVQYQHNDFDTFVKLNNQIQKSILRAQGIRKSLEKDPSLLIHASRARSGEINWQDPDLKRPFANNEKELQERIGKAMVAIIDLEKRNFGEGSVMDHQAQAMDTLEAQFRERENHYLFRDEQDHQLPIAQQDNLFAEHVLKALAGSLDAHTTFYSKSEAYDVKTRLQKAFEGIGVALQQLPDGTVTINGMAPQGPAAKSGQLKIGDRLVEVDGHSVLKEPLDKIVEMMHGESGTDLQLGIIRSGGSQNPIKVSLKREEISLDGERVDTAWRSYHNGIVGVITLHSFYQGANGITSEEDVRKAIEQLRAKGPLLGLVLDLRENSGGFLGQAVKVAGLFITNGVIVISKYFNGEQHFYRDLDGKVYYDGPLVVLTSRATASAAEIVAQALQDYGVALVVGDDQTYGKGTIQNQTVTDNHSTSFFKVTVGRYYTVSGKTPQLNGVKADILAPGIFAFEHIGEKYLASTVPSDSIAEDYDDDLSDISAGSRAWFMRYYMPTLQHKQLAWRKLLPALKASSEKRVSQNTPYQRYLQNLKHGFVEAGETRDFQLDEAINVVEEMAKSQGK